MMDRVFKTVWMAAAALAALMLTLLLAPKAAADGVDAGTDRIEIAEDGTVTLVSGHMASEKIASVQFTLRVEGGAAQFAFADLGDRLTWCSTGEGTLDVYIAGTEPLMGEGVTSLVVGTVTGDVQNVKPVPESLEYVYGRRTVRQNVPETTRVDSLWEQLIEVLESANETYGTAHKYSQDSWDALNSAIDKIEQLRERDDLTQEDVTAAISAYHTAQSGLQLAGKSDLAALLASAREMDPSQYTAASYAALQSAISGAEAAASSDDADTVANAVQKLREALSGLVDQTSADSNGSLHSDPSFSGDDTQLGRNADAPVDSPAPASDGTSAGGAAAPGAPNTGDGTPLLLWAVTLGLSVLLLAVIVRRGRSRI